MLDTSEGVGERHAFLSTTLALPGEKRLAQLVGPRRLKADRRHALRNCQQAVYGPYLSVSGAGEQRLIGRRLDVDQP